MALEFRVHLPEGEEMLLGEQAHLAQGSVQNRTGMTLNNAHHSKVSRRGLVMTKTNLGEDESVAGAVLGCLHCKTQGAE